MIGDKMRIQKQVVIGLGEVVVTDEPEAVLMCVGLGSCIGLCVYDRCAKFAGMAHIVLPTGRGSIGKAQGGRGRYADTAIPLLIDMMCERGAQRSRLTVKMAGGASMIVSPGFGDRFNTGARNIEMAKEAVRQLNLKVIASDVGGHHGRTMKLFVASGLVLVESAVRESIQL